MRILVVSNQFAPVVGGIETFLRQLAPALRARGHDVAVLTGTHSAATEPRDEVDGIPVFRNDIVRAILRKDPFTIARCRREARAVVADFAPDVVHAHDSGPNLWTVADCGVPVLATVHIALSAFDREQLGPVLRQLGACAWVTGVSREVTAQLAEALPGLAGRVSTVANGIPVPDAPPEPYPDPAATPRRIVAAGRMVPQKGFDVLLQAFAHLAARDRDVELLLVGDGGSRGELGSLAARLGIAARVHMPGAVRHSEMAAVLSSASVVAIPSRFEGMPIVALEAGLAARPAVATPVQGLADVVLDGETGLLVPPDDPAALADALGELLDDPVRAARLGAAAHRHVVAHHSLDACVAGYEALYRRIAPAGAGDAR